MPWKRECPAKQGRGTQEKAVVSREEDTRALPGLQGFCAPCRYFRLVADGAGRVRRVCSFTGETLPSRGVSGCEFRRLEGGAA